MELSEKIQMLRKKEGLSQEGFAEKMGGQQTGGLEMGTWGFQAGCG